MAGICERTCEIIEPNLKIGLGGGGNLLANLREKGIEPEIAAKSLNKKSGEGLTPECFLCVVKWETILRHALKQEEERQRQGSPKSKQDKANENRRLKIVGHNGRMKKLKTVNNIKR